MPTASIPAGQPLLDETTVVEHLRRRGVLRPDEAAAARQLGGGVSNTVLAVDGETRRVVVKQALSRLRVEREWRADPGRTTTEGRALQCAARIAPESVPAVIDLDMERNVLVIEAAPAGATDWKHRLLHGPVDLVDVAVARRLGTTLGLLHAGTAHDPAVHREFDNWEAFDQLRVTPYFGSMVDDRPELGGIVGPHVEAMRERRVCLVHGDVSPKNLLVADGLLWLIDFEVACAGDPAFDVAFLLCHLTLKSCHRPDRAAVLRRCAESFLAAYAGAAPGLLGDERHAGGLLGCLLMARVDGRSPAEYLSPHSRAMVRALGIRLAASPPESLADAMSHATAFGP